jgi:micrococcal nuclease
MVLAIAGLLTLLPASSRAQVSAPPFTATVNSPANVRSGPGTTYEIVDKRAAGDLVNVRQCNDDCSWYLIGNQQWIAAFLVTPGRAAPQPSLATPVPTAALPRGSIAAVVNFVVDGDTIDVRIDGVDYRLRYIGIDSPENGQPWSQQATDYDAQLVAGQTVYLQTDVSNTDSYGRLLRYVYLPDGRMVNELLVAAGFAYASVYPPNVKYQARFASAERSAQQSGLGLWSIPATATPATRSPGVVVVPTTATRSGSGNCDPHYPTICVPPPPPDLDCGDIPHLRFTVLPGDPHRFDGDHDGEGCEGRR